MTSDEFVKTNTNTKTNKINKNTSKDGSMLENVEINEEKLDEIVQKNNI